ncbi:MAG: hypothetical protein M3O15_12205, partial [Acidobacteriota bacterium]|nr:hypothetical protein [Acidobacteriota bacterium]
MHRAHRGLGRAALGLAVAWAAFGFLSEVNVSLTDYDARDRPEVARTWRFATPPVGRLARCLAEVPAAVPAGSLTAFCSLPGRDDSEFVRWRWAAYLLPGLDLIPLAD